MSAYYIASLKHTHKSHEHITWWGRMSCGYTPVLGQECGTYVFGYAVDLNDGLDHIAVPVEAVERLLSPEPYFKPEYRNHMDPHDSSAWSRAVATAAEAPNTGMVVLDSRVVLTIEAELRKLQGAAECCLALVQAKDRQRPFTDIDVSGDMVLVRLTGLRELANALDDAARARVFPEIDSAQAQAMLARIHSSTARSSSQAPSE